MYIDRTAVARLLETKPSNIRKTQLIDERIQIQLWNSKDLVFVSLLQYKDCYATRDKQSQAMNGDNKKGIGTLLMVIGAIIAISGYFMDTSVPTRYGNVSNLDLISQQNKKIQFGGLAFIAGVILYSLDKKG
jgi:hypothetical protein